MAHIPTLASLTENVPLVESPLRTARSVVDDTSDESSGRARYLDAINRVLNTDFLDSPLRATLDSFKLGPLHLVSLVASARRSERTPALVAKDRHDAISFQYAVSGMSSGAANGRPLVSAPGSVMVLDFARPFFMRDAEPRDVINVSVPRGLIEQLGFALKDLHGRMLDPVGSAVLGGTLMALRPQLPYLPLDDGAPLGRILLDLIALLLRSTGTGPVEVSRQERLRGRAYQLIASRLGADLLTPDWLAARLNVSRSDLYAAFQEEGGVAKAIWRCRLDGAREALLNPSDERRIGEIGFAFGFSSDSHFARAFKAAFGITAGEARQRIISKQ